MTRFEWPVLIKAGLQGLGLHPEQFWSLTPAELHAMLGTRGPGPMARSRLEQLAKAFPDEKGS